MQYKKFLVYNICPKFPEDINDLIYTMVKNDAAKCIQRMYYNRVKLNLDILSYFLSIGSGVVSPYKFKRILVFFNNKIKYNFIHEPAIWIDAINDIYYPFGVQCRLQPSIDIANDLRASIIERIKISNASYCRTAIEWWEYF